MAPTRPAVIGSLALLVVGAMGGGCADPAAHVEPGFGTVIEVVDGDTLIVDIGGSDETVRLLGIDTPETVHPDKPVECFGPEASARMKALLAPGTEIRLERDAEARDRYDRLLVYVHRRTDDVFINEVLVTEGYASTLSIDPNTAYDGQLSRAQASARSASAGLWGACPPP